MNRLFRLYSINIHFRNAKALLSIKQNWSQSWKLKHCRWLRPSRKWMRSMFVCHSLVLIKLVSAISCAYAHSIKSSSAISQITPCTWKKVSFILPCVFALRRWQLFPAEWLIWLVCWREIFIDNFSFANFWWRVLMWRLKKTKLLWSMMYYLIACYYHDCTSRMHARTTAMLRHIIENRAKIRIRNISRE